jgi:hypothetical protein
MNAKERFRASKDLVAGYNDVVDSSRMVAAFDHALIYFNETLHLTSDPVVAAANMHRIEGAHRIIAILKSLNSEAPKSDKPNIQPLNYNV